MAWRPRFQSLLSSARAAQAKQRREQEDRATAQERRWMDEQEAERQLYPRSDRVDRKETNGV